MTRSSALDDFVSRAKAVTCAEVAAQRGWKLRTSPTELVGPCPVCGGKDGFNVSRRKNTFICHRAKEGGDALALIEHVDGISPKTDFLEACSILLGEPIPDREATGPSREEIARREAERRARRAENEATAARYRDTERAAAFAIWRAGLPAAGTPVEAYLAGRGLAPVPALRCAPALGYYAQGAGGRFRRIHTGPAMLAAIQRADGRFGGVHMTWIDPDKPGAKVTIVDPDTGEVLPAKKVRGSMKGGAIRLAGPPDAARLVVGEGIETTLTVMLAERERGEGTVFARTAWWAGVSLGNMGGRAAGRMPHPTATTTDRAGRARRVYVAGPDPDMDDADAFVPPDTVRELVLLGDGDSDRVTTEACLTRGARRAMRRVPGLVAAIRWAPAGADFNDVLRGAAASAEPSA